LTSQGDPARAKVPRDPADDYTPAMAHRRREFVAARTGAALSHVGRRAFDPSLLPGNTENFIDVAQVPIALAGPLCLVGEHARGDL
jgi:hydroxymethylglutaryl-CoA reductase (NADPH)